MSQFVTDFVFVFLSTLSLRRATNSVTFPIWVVLHFYPRSPCGERLPLTRRHRQRMAHFYPRSPCGERREHPQNRFQLRIFLSTLSLRRATTEGSICFDSRLLFLSTLSLRRATAASVKTYHWIHISIHALLAESDSLGNSRTQSDPAISIHALLAESDPSANVRSSP